jgi:hypothetical protein
MKRHRALLLDERLTATIIEIQDTRQLSVGMLRELNSQSHERFDELSHQINEIYCELSKKIYEDQDASSAKEETRKEREDLEYRKSVVVQNLGHPDYDADQRLAAKNRFATSGDWVLQEAAFLNWLNGQDSAHSMLYVHGKPGAGRLHVKPGFYSSY